MARDEHLQRARADALELILEAILDPRAWDGFLDHLCQMLGGTSGALAIRSRAPGIELIDPVAANWPVGAVEAYLSYPRESDPMVVELAIGMFQACDRSAFVTQNLVDEGLFCRSAFFNEFANEFGMPYLAGISFNVGASHFGTLQIFRESGACTFDTSELRFLESLRRSLQVGLDARLRLKGASVAQGVLSRLDIPVIVLGQRAQVDYANPAAERLLRRGDSVRVSRGRLRTDNTKTTAALQALCLNAVSGHISRQGSELLLQRRSGRCPLRLLVLPLAFALSDSLWGGDLPVAILFFDADEHDYGDAPPDVEQILRTSYGCTAAEARNAILYAGGATASEVARGFGVSIDTVKTHLKSARRKTGTKNKAELAQLIQSLNPPLKRWT